VAQQIEAGLVAIVDGDGTGAPAVICSWAAAASLTSRNSPCSSWTVTPEGSRRKTSRKMRNSLSKSLSLSWRDAPV
jgi:hypothetical protein